MKTPIGWLDLGKWGWLRPLKVRIKFFTERKNFMFHGLCALN